MRACLVALILTSVVVGCAETASQNGTIDDVILIRASELGNAYPAALGQGKLVVEEGCLAMVDGSQPPSFVLWPPNFELQRGRAGIEVVDGDGDLVAGVGEAVQLGGGWMHLSPALDLTEGRVPKACRVSGERYFIASPAVGWELDGVTLLRSRSESLSGDEALAEGTLGERNGCVALLDDDGEGPYLVWPRLYTLVGGPTEFQVQDGNGRGVADFGSHLRIGGSGGIVEDPRSLPGGIPGACQGSDAEYWFVGERLPAA
ncbi:MAG: hypothetical protein ACRDHC_06130 [Actinomycetota bacterium]